MSSPHEPPPNAVARPPWSLRSELIASHVGLVAVIVLAFGGALYGLMRYAMYRQAEADLLGAAQVLIQNWQARGGESSLEIAQAYRHRFGPAPRDHAYFAVWDAAGRQLAGSDPLPPHALPASKPPPTSGPRPFAARTHGPHLEVILATPDGGQLLIGRPLAKEFDGLHRLLAWLAAFAALSLLGGWAGAWWLSRRIAQPIERLTATAERISSKRLDQRLELDRASRELVQLEGVFNRMLDGLQDAFHRQTRFTADASHELRTPVAVITSQAEHTLSRPRSPEEYQLALETCLSAAQRMKRLIDDLLLLARADSGRLELRQESVDLADVVKPVLKWLQPLAGEKRIRLTSQLQHTPLVGDASRLSQVITNLVTNALQYNVSDGDVFVAVHPQDHEAWLIVSDRGPGIPAAAQPHLFERFYRVDQARTHDAGTGTGLGLSIVSEIVAAHGGQVSIASKPNAGTTVTVRLPSGGT